jgi:hypothetical protein
LGGKTTTAAPELTDRGCSGNFGVHASPKQKPTIAPRRSLISRIFYTGCSARAGLSRDGQSGPRLVGGRVG